MIPVNGYTYLPTMQALLRSNTTDAPDDGVLQELIEDVSRVLDDITNRQFFPAVETHYFDTPRHIGDELNLGDDLLELLTFTNGDGTIFTSSQYKLYPLNEFPTRWIRILGSSTNQWALSPNGDKEAAISILGTWNYHDHYAQSAWRQLTTLSGNMDAVTLSASVGSIANILAGQLIKIGTEFMRVASAAAGVITLDSRAVNGSTAATHSTNDAVYLWVPISTIRRCTEVAVKYFYDQRFGQGAQGTAHVTAAGVVITPSGLPNIVLDMIAEAGFDMPGIG